MIFQSGSLSIRPMVLAAAGDVIAGHAHAFDHTTYVVRGSILVERLDENGAVVQSVTKRAAGLHNWVLILAGAIHRITALEDNTLGHCVYVPRNEAGEIVEFDDGWSGAYE